MFDLVIRNGTVLDGSGAPRRIADIAVQDGKIAAVGPKLGTGKREIDAAGLIVAPGFVDIHTHYDGQATWDPFVTPSSWHGVTTTVFGNCGVGFAPVRPGKSRYLINLMEGVEDIPGHGAERGREVRLGVLPAISRCARFDAPRRRRRGPTAARRAALLRHGRARRRARRGTERARDRGDGAPHRARRCGPAPWASRRRAPPSTRPATAASRPRSAPARPSFWASPPA